MKKLLFEEMGGTCTLVGDYYLLTFKLSAEENDRPLGVWARRMNCVKEQAMEIVMSEIVYS